MSSSSSSSPVQLTREETRLLEECDRESLFYRSIPLSVLSVFGVQYAMTKNLISLKGKWFKFGSCMVLGYFLGKLSYAPACRKKILAQLPNSSLAQLIQGVESSQAAPVIVAFPTESKSSDEFSTPIGVNQYGDPIYKSTK